MRKAVSKSERFPEQLILFSKFSNSDCKGSVNLRFWKVLMSAMFGVWRPNVEFFKS